ncbi:MAG: PD-(D/E)XK nuclease family protein [Candidatus Aenigmarchaeota archaeon]|nr:PD-(D/E)XK nuclease family protein [Candidatus Aenigmarchaeota archaeon]
MIRLKDFLEKKTNKIRLSPTAISTYYMCPRKFFYIYIKGLKEKPTPAKIRGSITHKVLENFFDFVDLTKIDEKENWEQIWKKFRDILFKLLESEWSEIGKKYEDCFKNNSEKKRLFDETKEFLNFYAIKLSYSLHNKLQELNRNSEWFEQDLQRFFFPKNREMKLEIKNEDIIGFVDKTMSLFGNGIAIVDYKTSRCSLPHFIPESHLKQGKAYAYLWKQTFGELPKHISFYYLRTGESVFYPISELDIKEIENDIKEIRNKKPIIEEFPKKESRLCKFCDFKKICGIDNIDKKHENLESS